MNKTQEALVILSEECAEVIQASAKCLRFGMQEKNLNQLKQEIADVMILIEIVSRELEISDLELAQLQQNKMLKLQEYSNLL
jgi:NTP pyrophosphatase (non-canonical NTP hydrolase)